MTERDLCDRYVALPEEGKRLVDEFVALLGRAYAPACLTPGTPIEPFGDPTESEFFAMWADRADLADPDYVRKLRRREWGESA